MLIHFHPIGMLCNDDQGIKHNAPFRFATCQIFNYLYIGIQFYFFFTIKHNISLKIKHF